MTFPRRLIFALAAMLVPLSAETAEPDESYPILSANQGKSTGSAERIMRNAEDAPRLDSLNFYGFYTGMSLADAKTLREHYGLTQDHLQFRFNKQNGEVVRIRFTPKAITRVMNAPNNFPTIEARLLDYFEIVAWNNEREIVQGRIDSFPRTRRRN